MSLPTLRIFKTALFLFSFPLVGVDHRPLGPVYDPRPERSGVIAQRLVAELFRGHEVLRDYAAALGARIVNRTRGSMIDAYERNPE